jgi:hypothetical protein
MILPPEPEEPGEKRIGELIAITEGLGVELLGAPGELPY